MIVAFISGFLDGVVVVAIDPTISLRGLSLGVLIFAAKAGGLYLAKHPIDNLRDDTTMFEKKTEV